MNLQEQFQSLSPPQQKHVHLTLCEKALGVWTNYARLQSEIRYFDSVVGGSHVVERYLPEEALRCVRYGTDPSSVAGRYGEPIVAMQDDDLEFPDHVDFAYYAIFNCFRRHALNDDLDAWLVVNQALSAETDECRWRPMLEAAIATAVAAVPTSTVPDAR